MTQKRILIPHSQPHEGQLASVLGVNTETFGVSAALAAQAAHAASIAARVAAEAAEAVENAVRQAVENTRNAIENAANVGDAVRRAAQVTADTARSDPVRDSAQLSAATFERRMRDLCNQHAWSVAQTYITRLELFWNDGSAQSVPTPSDRTLSQRAGTPLVASLPANVLTTAKPSRHRDVVDLIQDAIDNARRLVEEALEQLQEELHRLESSLRDGVRTRLDDVLQAESEIEHGRHGVPQFASVQRAGDLARSRAPLAIGIRIVDRSRRVRKLRSRFILSSMPPIAIGHVRHAARATAEASLNAAIASARLMTVLNDALNKRDT